MRTINIFTRLSSIALLAASFCAGQEIRTVVAEGVGSDPQSAAQDAAQNALTDVVGSFIDANKQLEKRSEIRDGIRSQTKQIRTDIKEYSQGSIQSFEIAETKKDGIFFRVTAKVGVRVADFRAYVKKLAEGETSVGGGLFAEMSTTQKQSGSLAKILSERILAVVNGEVIRFSVSKPVPFRRSRFADSANLRNLFRINSLARQFSPDQLAVFEVTATLDEAFLANLVQTLDSVAASKKRIATTAEEWSRYTISGQCDQIGSSSGEPVQRSGQDSSFCLPLMDRNPGTATVYRFSNVDHELTQNLHWTFMIGNGSFDVEGDLVRGSIKLPTLEVAVLGKDKNELQVELIPGSDTSGSPYLGGRKTALDADYPGLLYGPTRLLNGPHSQMGRFGNVLHRQRTFSVVMKIEDTALRQADSIRVKLVK